jgi:DNA polymerase III delta prime subunit
MTEELPAEEPADQELAEEAAPPADMQFLQVQEEAQFLADSEVIGANVVNNMDEQIGSIADLVMDEDQKLVGVVLSVGGFLGMGAKWVAVPVEQAHQLVELVDGRTGQRRVAAQYRDGAALVVEGGRERDAPVGLVEVGAVDAGGGDRGAQAVGLGEREAVRVEVGGDERGVVDGGAEAFGDAVEGGARVGLGGGAVESEGDGGAGSGGAPPSGEVPGVVGERGDLFEDVGGMRETIEMVREAVELPITHPEIFKKMGIRPHKGILFYGPPGTGKTLLARAVAHESGAHFIAVSGPEILNKYWGQSEARLRSIFNEARAKAPAIILFDELDSFASARDMMSESFEATLVSQLLSLMDGLNDLGRVCVIAPTDRPGAIDLALRRPGRFDHEIEIGLPDAEARLHILKIHTREMPTDPDLDLGHIAQHTGSYSGADLEALCREAALVCMRRTINLRDFEKRIAPHQLSALSVTTYDFRTAIKRVGPSIRR